MSNFSKNMKAWAAKVNAGVNQVTRAALIDVSTRIVKRTPVGNPSNWKSKPPIGYVGGRSRGSWFASIGAPIISTENGTIDNSGGASIDRSVTVAKDAVGSVYYFTNNLPYIGRLEYQGWSTQAPNGMVRVSVLEFNAALRKAINEL